MSNVPIYFGYDEYNNVDRVLANDGPVSSQNYFYISEELYSEYVNIEAELKYIKGIYKNKIEEIEKVVDNQRMLFLAEKAKKEAKSEEEKLQDIKRAEYEASQNRILEILSKDNPTRKEKEFVLRNSSEWENIHGGWWAKYGVGFEFAKAFEMCKEDHLEAEKDSK